MTDSNYGEGSLMKKADSQEQEKTTKNPRPIRNRNDEAAYIHSFKVNIDGEEYTLQGPAKIQFSGKPQHFKELKRLVNRNHEAVLNEIHTQRWLWVITSEIDPALVSFPVPMRIFIQDDMTLGDYREIEKKLLTIAKEVGLEHTLDLPYIKGSYDRIIWFFKNAANNLVDFLERLGKKPEIQNSPDIVVESLITRYRDVPQSQVLLNQANAIKALAEASADYKSGIVMLGDLLIVRTTVDDEPFVWMGKMDKELMLMMYCNPDITKSPNALYEYLVGRETKQLTSHE